MTQSETSIAEGLSEAQRTAIRVPARGCTYLELGSSSRASTINALQRRGIVDEIDNLTPLGLRIRSYLISKGS